jgi:hypothetical protein
VFTPYEGYEIMEDKVGGTCSMNEKAEKFIHILIGSPERKKPLRRYRRKWKRSIKMDLNYFISGLFNDAVSSSD